MALANTILKILSNKWTYIAVLLIGITIIFGSFMIQIRVYKEKIKTLDNEIEDLKVTNTILYKDNLFKKEQLSILIDFSNSSEAINKIINKELNNEDKNAINAIRRDFYNYFMGMSNY